MLRISIVISGFLPHSFICFWIKYLLKYVKILVLGSYIKNFYSNKYN